MRRSPAPATAGAFVILNVLLTPSAIAGPPPAGSANGGYLAVGASATAFQNRCTGGACDRSDIGARIAGGWTFARHWSVEALYLNAGNFTASDVTPTGVPFQGRAKVQAFGVGLGYGWPVGPSLVLSARAGLASVKADFSPGASPAIAGGKTTSQALGGLSATWRYSSVWSARLDWDHTRGRMNRFDGDVDMFSAGFQYGF